MSLSPDEAKAILSSPQSSTRPKRVKLDTSERTISVWFRLVHHLGFCSNPNCRDTRPTLTVEGNTMVSTVNGLEMCRICFIDGYGNK